jgi:hypothetical protein
MPKSKRQIGRRLAAQRAKVAALRKRVAQARDPRARALLQRKLAQEVAVLRRMTAGARTKKAKRTTPPGTEKVSGAKARARKAAIKRKLKVLDKEQARAVSIARKVGPDARQSATARVQAIQAQRRALGQRLGLIKRGLDVEQPRRIHPSRAPIQRERLGLPSAYAVPTRAETVALMRLIATQIRRQPFESGKEFRDRLRAYLRRGLVRFVNNRTVKVLPEDQALAAAVNETVAIDGPVIEAEVKAGGIVIDPVAEAMEPMVIQVAPEIEQVTTDLQPDQPRPEVTTPESVEDLMFESGEKATDLLTAPEELYDELEESLDDEELALLDEDEETPFYKRPMVIGGIAIIGLGAFLLMRQRS